MTSSTSALRATKLPSLTNRDVVHDERHLTGRLLRELANDLRFNTREHELHALADAVTEGGSREAIWRGIDLQPAFTAETTIRPTRRLRRRLAGIVGALAGIVVFFPVALTWWALHRATAAYQTLLASGLKEGGTSFLQLWTTGFGDKLEQHFRLSNVALSATIIIAAGVALIVLERFLSRSADRADDDEYRDCASRLARTLNYASLTINSGNIDAPAQGLELIGESVAQLLDAHRHTRDAAGLLTRAAHELDEYVARATSNLESSQSTLLAGFKNSVDLTVTSLGTSVQGVTDELIRTAGSISQDFGQSIINTSGTLETSITAVAGKLSASAAQVAAASTEMQLAAAASATAQQALAGAASGIGTSIHNLETNLRAQLQDVTAAINGEVAALGKVTGDFAKQTSDGTDHIGRKLGLHTSALQHQISELTQIRASLERLINDKSLGSGR